MINQDHKKFQVKTIFAETSGRPKGRPLMTSWDYKEGGGAQGGQNLKKDWQHIVVEKWQRGKKWGQKAGKTQDVIYERPLMLELEWRQGWK